MNLINWLFQRDQEKTIYLLLGLCITANLCQNSAGTIQSYSWILLTPVLIL